MKRPRLIPWVSGTLLILLLALIAIHGGIWPVKRTPGNLPPAPTALDTATPPPAVIYWQQKFPQYQLVKWAPGFLTGDDQEDAVIIYRTGSKCYLVAVINQPGGGFQATDPLAAPASDQQISVGDVDNKNPNEIVVSGQKNGAYGYAVFALDKNRLLTLYSAGMDQCC
jgi:hypothetical protein